MPDLGAWVGDGVHSSLQVDSFTVYTHIIVNIGGCRGNTRGGYLVASKLPMLLTIDMVPAWLFCAHGILIKVMPQFLPQVLWRIRVSFLSLKDQVGIFEPNVID